MGLVLYCLAQTKEQTKPEKGGEAPESIGPKGFLYMGQAQPGFTKNLGFVLLASELGLHSFA